MQDLKGIIVAMATPFHADESLAPELIAPLIEKLLADGVHGIFAAGSCGENYALSNEERVILAIETVKAVKGRVPVIMGAGMPTTIGTIKTMQALQDTGVDVLSIVLPYFTRPTQDELYRHFMDIAEHSCIPLMLYNIPQYTGTNLEPKTAGKLSKTGKYIAVKDSAGKFEQFEAYKAACDPSFTLIMGSDRYMYDGFIVGASAAITAPGNALSRIPVAIYENFVAGNLEAAAQAQEDWKGVLAATRKIGTMPSQNKVVTSALSSPVGPARRPAYPVDEKVLAAAIEKLQPYIEKYYGK